MMDRKTLATICVAFAIGYWVSSSPVAPHPWQPRPERPVLRWIVRAAKNLLWIAVIAEPAPTVPNDRQLVHAPPIGEDGYPLVDHGKGF